MKPTRRNRGSAEVLVCGASDVFSTLKRVLDNSIGPGDLQCISRFHGTPTSRYMAWNVIASDVLLRDWYSTLVLEISPLAVCADHYA